MIPLECKKINERLMGRTIAVVGYKCVVHEPEKTRKETRKTGDNDNYCKGELSLI
jgi:hypothetical protein